MYIILTLSINTFIKTFILFKKESHCTKKYYLKVGSFATMYITFC
jgi:hypothetical protein